MKMCYLVVSALCCQATIHQMFEKFFDYFFELSLPESGILVNQDNFMHAEHVLSPNCLGQQGKPLIY
jgi:hypothetical protein